MFCERRLAAGLGLRPYVAFVLAFSAWLLVLFLLLAILTRLAVVVFAFDVFLCHTVISCVTEPFGFEWLALPSVALFFD